MWITQIQKIIQRLKMRQEKQMKVLKRNKTLDKFVKIKYKTMNWKVLGNSEKKVSSIFSKSQTLK